MQDKYKAGALILVTEGQYSDQSTHGLFRALRDFTAKEAVAEFLKANPQKTGRYGFTLDAITPSLVANGYVEELDYSELWLGGYSTINPEIAPSDWPGATY
jgi:hypothetical protein